jgi:hypothetical protein
VNQKGERVRLGKRLLSVRPKVFISTELDLQSIPSNVMSAIEAAFVKLEKEKAQAAASAVPAGKALASLRKHKCTWAAASAEDNPVWIGMLKKYEDFPRKLKTGSDLNKRVALHVSRCFGGALEAAIGASDNPLKGTILTICRTCVTILRKCVTLVRI